MAISASDLAEQVDEELMAIAGAACETRRQRIDAVKAQGDEATGSGKRALAALAGLGELVEEMDPDG